MGKRNRRDPVGHMENNDTKGKPTPEAPQNGEQPVEQGGGPAPPVVVFMPVAVMGELNEHPRLGLLIDLHFQFPGGGEAICRFPTEYWPVMRDEVDALYDALPEVIKAQETQARAAQSGIVVGSSPADIAAAAAAREKASKAESALRQEGGEPR